MDNAEDVENRNKVYKKLEERRRILELKISEKNFELKKVCVAEAELTGVIPREIPLEPDESPPKIKRRVGTMFPFSEEVIYQLQPPCLPDVGRSPKRKLPLCPWNSGSNTLPAKSSEARALSPRSHATWGPQGLSPAKQPIERSPLFSPKFNILKKW